MIFKPKKEKKPNMKEKYIDKVIRNATTISLEKMEYVNKKTHQIEKLFPQDCNDNWNAKLILCDVNGLSIAERVFFTDHELDVIVIISFNKIRIFVRNLYEYRNLITDFIKNIENSYFYKLKRKNQLYFEFEAEISKDKLSWFDTARLNAFIKAAGNLDFPIMKDE